MKSKRAEVEINKYESILQFLKWIIIFLVLLIGVYFLYKNLIVGT